MLILLKLRGNNTQLNSSTELGTNQWMVTN